MLTEQLRFSYCVLALMSADIAAREGDKTQAGCVKVRDMLRKTLCDEDPDAVTPDGRLSIEDYETLRTRIAIGSTREALGLLVELCAAQPWLQVDGKPDLDERARDHFLSRLGIDLPGDADEDDFEYVDEALDEGRRLEGWSTARWAVVIGGGTLLSLVTGGLGVFVVGGAVAGAGAAAVIAGLAAAEIAAVAGVSVLAGVGATFGAIALTEDMPPEYVEVAVVKRFALVRMLRRYPDLADRAHAEFDELTSALDDAERMLAELGDGEDDKSLKRKRDSLARAVKRLNDDE